MRRAVNATLIAGIQILLIALATFAFDLHHPVSDVSATGAHREERRA